MTTKPKARAIAAEPSTREAIRRNNAKSLERPVEAPHGEISRSCRWKISRVRNVLIRARNMIGELGLWTEDVAPIGIEVFRMYENICVLIEALNAAAPQNRGEPSRGRSAPQAARE